MSTTRPFCLNRIVHLQMATRHTVHYSRHSWQSQQSQSSNSCALSHFLLYLRQNRTQKVVKLCTWKSKLGGSTSLNKVATDLLRFHRLTEHNFLFMGIHAALLSDLDSRGIMGRSGWRVQSDQTNVWHPHTFILDLFNTVNICGN